VCFACFAEKVEACGARIFLLEDWGEDGEGGMVRCGPSDFCGRVTETAMADLVMVARTGAGSQRRGAANLSYVSR
jgi:hypothetical protein